MFKLLKDKLKDALSSFGSKIKSDEVAKEEIVQPEPIREVEVTEKEEEIIVPEVPVTSQAKEIPVEKERIQPVKSVQEKTPLPEKKIERENLSPPKQESFFSRVTEKFTTVQLSPERFEELFWDLELALLENNVAVEVIEKIKAALKDELTQGRTARGSVEERIQRRLEETIASLLNAPSFHILEEAQEYHPYVVVLVGVNGSGKTTTVAKLARYFTSHGKSVVLGAADTFRAAAIQQLEEHAKKIKVPLIKQGYGADPAAVAFDTIQYAKAKGTDVVLIDTAGRMHSNTNLMDELKKLIRVAKPHRIIFIGEATTGNDCVEQARYYSEALAIDGVILSKADVDEKGGAALSVSYVTGKPILFLGTGQAYDDLVQFAPEQVVHALTQ